MLAGHQALPVTSLRGEYLYIMVQITRDLQPVVCSDWILPETGFELGVSDVTLLQFQQVAARLSRDVISVSKDSSPDWMKASRTWMIPLAKLLEESPLPFSSLTDLNLPTCFRSFQATSGSAWT